MTPTPDEIAAAKAVLAESGELEAPPAAAAAPAFTETEPRPDETQSQFDARRAEALAGSAPLGSLATATPEDAAASSTVEITHTEPVLAQGATGDAVARLVRLLAQAGFATNSIVNASPSNPHAVLDSTVMADVDRFWQAHPEAREPDELYTGREGGIHELQGSWVGPHTWQALYNLASAGSSAG